MANENIYQSIFAGQEIDRRLSEVSALQTAIQDILAALSDIYDKEQVDAIAASIAASVNSDSGVVVATLPTASADTVGKIYYIGPDANGFYDRYVTSYDGSAYSWIPMGNTQMDLAGFVTTEEFERIEYEVEGGSVETKTAIDTSALTAVTRYITSNNTWNSGNNGKGIFIPITPGKKYGVKFTNLQQQASSWIAVTTDNATTISSSVSYATGYSSKVACSENEEYTFVAPSDAAYLYIQTRYSVTSYFVYAVYEYGTEDVPGLLDKVEEMEPKVDTLWEERNARLVAFPVDTVAWGSSTIESGATFRNSYYIRVAEGTWNSGADYLSTRLPVFGARRVAVTPGEYGRYYIAFLKDAHYSVNAAASFCDGYGSVITGTESAEYTIPVDCKYLYVFNKYNGTGVTPASLILYYDKTEAVQRRRPIVSFIDDDGMKAQMQWLEPIVAQTGVPISIALIASAVGNANYCTWDELRRWRNMGFNFVGHMGTRITDIDPAELPARFAALQAAMEAHGMLDSNLFVLPNGSWDQVSKAIVAEYFEASFNVTARVNAPPISDRYLLRRVSMDQGPTMLDAWKGWVDNAIQTRGWVIFYSHARGEIYTEDMRAAYIDLINYCKGKGVDILSVPDGWKYYKQFIPPIAE